MLLQQTLIGIASFWNPKAAQWTRGRRNWRQRIRQELHPEKKRIWMHVASLGEFEQASPLIEKLNHAYPSYDLVLTFFSPSGYEWRKNDKRAQHIFYLPSDMPENARDFIDLVRPDLCIFIKYEFWYNYLHTLHKRKIPVILVSAAFMPEHSFFQWWGGFFRNMLGFYDMIFVQDAYNQRLLQTIGVVDPVAVTGDTRYDRVVAVAAAAEPVPAVESFCRDHYMLVAGSTWPADERLLKELLAKNSGQWKMILAPHEVHPSHIQSLQQIFTGNHLLFSELQNGKLPNAEQVLIIDNIGWLSRLYAYGDVAYVGGGFRKRGLHNILEPAAFGLPILIGPEYRNFVEAIRFVQEQFAFPVRSATEANEKIRQLTIDTTKKNALRESIRAYMQQHTGAAEKVLQFIEKKQWLSR